MSTAERLLGVIGWVVGVAIAFITGSALVSRAYVLSYMPEIVSALLGWFILILTLLGIILSFATRHGSHNKS